MTVDRGRNFSDAEDRAGADSLAIVSAGFAQRRFPAADATGRTLLLENTPLHGDSESCRGRFELFQPADVYVAFGPWCGNAARRLEGGIPASSRSPGSKPGVSLEQARVEMDTISRQLEAEFPESNRNTRALVTRAQDQLVQNVRPALRLLTGAVALVLLIGCANVANLLLPEPWIVRRRSRSEWRSAPAACASCAS